MEVTTWIKKAVALHLRLPDTCNIDYALESPSFKRFVDSSLPQLLFITYAPDNDEVSVSTDFSSLHSLRRCVAIAKTKASEITVDDLLENVQIIPLWRSPANMLYQTLHTVFAPTLLKDQNAGISPQLQNLISDLDHSLARTLIAGQNPSLKGADETDLHAIGTLEDELLFWTVQASSHASKTVRARAQLFHDILQPLKLQYDTLSSMATDEVSELIETTQDVLDDLWRQVEFEEYSQDRMRHLLNIISEAIINSIHDKLGSSSFMVESFSLVKEDLQASTTYCMAWSTIASTLTEKLWPYYSSHQWQGPGFTSEQLSLFLNRLTEILTLRSTHDLTLGLLSLEEQRDLHADEALDVFATINPLQTNKYAEQSWKSAISVYNQNMQPIEQQAAAQLRAVLGELQSSPGQLLREFHKYGDLIKRPSIATLLASERDILLEQLSSMLKALNRDFDSLLSAHKDSTSRNVPNQIGNIVWVRQALTKSDETDHFVENCLGANSSYSKLSSEFYNRLKTFEKEQFEEWVADTETLMDDPNGFKALRKTGRLMELDFTDGRLRVNFADDLITLIREVRQLLALGFAVPAKIQKDIENAQTYYRHGVVLKQVAHFYNNINEQLLPTQHAMLLEPALAFERIVKNPPGDGSRGDNMVKWDDPQQLEAYIMQIQQAAERLTSSNRRLRKHHAAICDNVISLFDFDLVKDQAKWKDTLGTMRGIVGMVQESGVRLQDTLTWRNHWDFQLYKVLEHQYQKGLENLSETLPEFKVDLIFKQQKLQYRPPLEEVRSKYYREMKRFINIPAMFRGIGEVEVFKNMIDSSAASLSQVYRKANSLFQSLEKVQETFEEWVVLGTVDLDDIVEQNLLEVSDYEANFRALKAKGKESEQLPAEYKVDCFTISTLPVKTAIDDHLQRLFDAMVHALRKSVTEHLAAVDEFVTKGTTMLSMRPQSLAEIGEANAQHKELSEAQSAIKRHFDEADTKNKLLKSVAGAAVDTSVATSRWAKLEIMLESHELMIKEQVDVLRSQIEGRRNGFMVEFEKFAARWNQFKPKSTDLVTDPGVAAKAMTFIKEKQSEFEELKKASTQIVEDCKHFSVELQQFHEVEEIEADITASKDMWFLYEEYSTELESSRNEDWISYRNKVSAFDDFLNRWMEKLRSRPADAIAAYIQKEVDSYRETVPILKFLRGDNWTTEHWAELFRLAGVSRGVTLSDLTFGHILDCKEAILRKITEIKDLNSRAQGEITIREAIQEMELWGVSAMFALSDYQDAKEAKMQIIKEWKETMTQIGDNQSLLQSLKESPYYKFFADKGSAWEQKFAALDEYLRNLNAVQRKWVYLEPIFSRGALPNEQSRFARVDDSFRTIMSSIARDPRVVSIVSFPGIKETLVTLVDQLERCQKALNEFLELKRARFARFYFIGDDDLLEILGQAKNPNVIQAHLKKLFAGVHNVQFDDNVSSIIGMKSIDGEVVTLERPVKVTDEVEVWLENFAREMKSTMQHLLQQCLTVTDIFKYPVQILSLTEYLHFTANVETILANGGSFVQLEHDLKAHLEEYTSFDSAAIEDPVDRLVNELKVKYLILDIIHLIDVVKQLRDAQVKDLNDWEWRRQLRFYMSDDNICQIRMSDAEFLYTYEYQGIPPKLVHTPLTDKCYLTLTQAMASGFGGNPFGPAGTGKTESVKALGVLFGRQVLVFNCDEGIDYKSMGRIFVGLVKCGAWGCFDEFNRLEEAVLSAVSQQIQVIQAALKHRLGTVDLLGKTVSLDANSGIFVTLNPAGKGYGGRQKLPDNLKQLFRSIAMTHPNNELISEVILFSEGFKYGKELGRKVVSVFTLCRQLLSTQQHYDWGLRPLKAVLGLAGRLLHQERRTQKSIDIIREAAVMVKALRVNTLSKLTFADSQRFEGLMNDVFPNIPLEEVSYQALEQAVRDTYAEMNLVYIESQTEKVFQFYQACLQRMGVVIVGPSGSGKSTLWQVLKHAWQKMGQKLQKFSVNPKAIDRTALLGHMDIDTREWHDGVLTAASRQAVKEASDVHTWIICDGDVDPEWVESLNSVLDDNRLLTMPNGERIQFGPNVNFIFETHNLKFASPATVSRMGMIFLSDETLNLRALVSKWLMSQPESIQQQMADWLNDVFYKSIEWILANANFVIETTKVGLAMNGLSHLGGVTSRQQFLYSLIRGLGANLLVESRLKFANEVLTWAGSPSPDPKRTLDYFVDKDDRLCTYHLVEPDTISSSDMADVDHLPVIQTVDIQKGVHMITPWLQEGHPFLVTGPEGAGKQMILRYCFSTLKSVSVAMIHCSAQTRSSHILTRLYQNCTGSQTNTGRVLRPKDSEKLILYLKDINLPRPDKYETVELVQFLQQVLTYQGFYDHNLDWVAIENVQIVASMNPANTMGRHRLSTRFTSVIRQCFVPYADRDQLQSAYRLLASSLLTRIAPAHPVWSLPRAVQKLAVTMVTTWEQVFQSFNPDVHPHYIFTPRDLSQWLLGLGRYQVESQEPEELLGYLSHEAIRLFEDVLTDQNAKQKFALILGSVLKSEWNYDVDLKGVLYSSSLQGLVINNSARGLQKLSNEQYSECVTKALRVYERDYRDLHIVLMPEALQQIAQIERVLGQRGGSLLLVGRPGVGRLHATLIASHMLGLNAILLNVGRNYTAKSFVAELKSIIQSAAIQGRETVWIVEDYQLSVPTSLETINCLLSSGEVPGLYAQDELDVLLSALKDAHSEAGYQGSLYEFFMVRVRTYLHIVLIMDSVSSDLIPNCEANPALYTRCQIIWLDKWNSESMMYSALDVFERDQHLNEITAKTGIIKQMMTIHSNSAPRATPKHFNDYLATYRQVHSSKLQSLLAKQAYLDGGLRKMKEALIYVDKLSAEAKLKGEELAEKQKQADQALKQITESMVRASEQKREMEDLSGKLKTEEDAMIKRKKEIENELSEVEPIVRSAKSAVGEIKSESLSEIRSLRAPPPAIRDVLEGVLRLMGILDMSWNSMKSFLGKRTIKDEIMNFDARTIKPPVRNSVADLLRQKGDSFEETTIKRVSVAAAPLAAWVKANLQYSTILEKIAPLEGDLQRLTQSLDGSRERVLKLKQELSVVDETVAELKRGFGQKTSEAETLRSSLTRAKETIQAAQGLLGKLSGEGERWASQMTVIKSDLKALPSMTVLSAAFVTYLADASEEGRAQTAEEWAQIANLSDFDFLKSMSSESEQLIWKAEGLPSDQLSNENAVMILTTPAVPLIIDPSGQAVTWLKNHLSQKKPEVVNQHDESFARAVELAVRFGKTLIVQEVSMIEPFLYPIIRKDLQKQGPRFVVQLGDKTVDYHDDFRLYLITNQAAFALPTNAAAFVQSINFTVTRAGLAGQLLGVTLKHEKPELEVKKLELLKQEDTLKLQLAALEDSLLKELASSQGNILENKALIHSLNETQDKSLTIATSLQESHRLQSALDAERGKFAPLAAFGSTLYFVVTDLCNLNNMYQFSLSAYLRLFEQSLHAGANGINEDAEQRTKSLMGNIERATFKYISRSLFKDDRLMFALHMAQQLHPELFATSEWEFFTGQLVVTDEDSISEIPQWVPAERQASFKLLQSTKPELVMALDFSDSAAWLRWMKEPACEKELPKAKCSAFQKVLITQVLRPDRLLTALNDFSCSALHLQSLTPPPLNLAALQASETIPREPVLFITTAGADPSQELRDFAAQQIGADKFFEVAMGQGQGDLAVQLLRSCAASGGWLYLQNIHLVTSWLPTVEKELSALKLQPSFRLWLSTEAHAKFPVSLLQNCLKITVEAPPGVKKNLQRTFAGWTPSYFSDGPVYRAQALFSLGWFHAVIQERRTYIPQGWTKFYEFSSADLRSGAELIHAMCSTNKGPQWETLQGLLENAIYGGRIDDNTDSCKLQTYLRQLFNDDIFTIGGRAPNRKVAKGIALPTTSDYSSYQQLINNLPEVDQVSSLGLPANVDRALQRHGSHMVVSQLKSLRKVDSSARRFDRERWSKELTPFLQLWKKLLSGTDILQKRPERNWNAEPLLSFLQLEFASGLDLVRQIDDDLGAIGKMIRGTLLVTNELVAVADQLLRGQTPASWMTRWEASESPQQYLRGVIANETQIDTWLGSIAAGTLFDSPLRMASLFHPITFLNALRQQTARQLKKPIDELKLTTTWGSVSLPSKSLSVTIGDIFIQGCTFDGARLQEAHPEDPTFMPSPNCNIAWVSESVPHAYDKFIELPLYEETSREKLVCKLIIPCADNHSLWILAGAAFFLEAS
ncbi:dynein heavy chain and region D6 of dynein motor-domain-containing protein [Phlyctochytrium arcticum]|nr:dynein heavy chain and region D6 of dynein motor-domain-containing protein [Phlyctochytrium arcticum]